MEHPEVLEGIGCDGPYEREEKCVYLLYNKPHSRSDDDSSWEMFSNEKRGL